MNPNNRNRNFKKVDDDIRKNSDIRYPEVRLLSEDRKPLGIMSSSKALSKAQEAGLDLLELSATANPPVCFLGSADKVIYEKHKKAKEQKKSKKATAVKEVKIRPNIADADAIRKLNDVNKFLSQNHRVKITMVFRGRDIGRIQELSERLTKMVMDHIVYGKIEGKPNRTHNQNTILLVPVHAEKKKESSTSTDETPIETDKRTTSQ